jgi:hypothetical protein
MKLCLALTAAAVSPVQKVVQLLGQLQTQVAADLAAEKKQFQDYASYCDDEITQKGFAIKTATSKISEYSAVIEESTGKIQGYNQALEQAGADVAKKEDELQSATSVRNAEKKAFQAADKELVDTIDTLARALVVLKRGLSLAQVNSNTSKKDAALLQALKALVSASGSANARRVEALLESEDEYSLRQPQATVKNYESKSGGIVEAIGKLQDEAEDNLRALRREETQKHHGYALLKQSLEDALSNLKESIDEASSNRGASEQVKAQAEEDLARTEASKAADEQYKQRLNNECAAKASEWSEREKSAVGEQEALAKAKEILTSGVKAFIQTSSNTSLQQSRVSDFTREKVIAHLKQLGRQFNSFAMLEIASAASSDPFVKIRGLIEGMINKLVNQAQEEASQEAFCQEETKKSSKKRDKKQALAEKHQTRIDKATSGTKRLRDEVSELTAEIGDLNKSTQAATKLRNSESAEYKKASKDYKDSAEAVGHAIEVLREYYGDASLMQVGAGNAQAPEFGGKRSDSGNSIISFLEVAESDFTRLLAEADSAEAQSSEGYKKLIQDSKVSLATKKADVNGKKSEIKQLQVALDASNSDLTSTQKELDAVLEYLDKLKPQCESKAQSYAERKSRRDAEVEGLKDALEILSGDAPAFLQRKTFRH